MIFHKIYNSWSWTGGHADGDSDLLKVAIKEASEETGLKNIKPISKDIFSFRCPYCKWSFEEWGICIFALTSFSCIFTRS